MDDKLKQILATHPRLWRASDRCRRFGGRNGWPASLETGYPRLNQALHAGGWPRGVSNELYLPGQGIGELRLLMPALRQLTGEGYLCWVAPPCLPFAPALVQQGLDLQHLLVIPAQSLADRLWAMEQALLAGCCTAVLGWFGREILGLRELRRLQLAAERSGCWSVLFRHNHCRSLPSPSALRLQLRPDPDGRLAIEILKQPGGWAGQQLTLSVSPHYEQWQRLPVELLPSYTANPPPVIPRASEHIATGDTAATVFSLPAATRQQH